MLHKVRNGHREILNGLPELKALLPSSVRNKKMLLEMARRGDPKPGYKTPLGKRLIAYTKKFSNTYDQSFEIEIRKVRPDWMVSRSEKVGQKKLFLIELARNGEPKPQNKSPLFVTLNSYTQKSGGCYDPNFDREIRKIRPDWFVSLVERTNKKKRLLMKMARNGKPRPGQKTSLGSALCGYTRNSSGRGYDPEFDKEIRKARPDWFVFQTELANQRKQLLLDMAKRGEPRPTWKHPFGGLLTRSTAPKSKKYDPAFTKKIMKLAPHWFLFQSEVANKKKQQLLKIAKEGKARPTQYAPLGRALCRYNSKNSPCHDPAFAKEIKRLAPQWFVSASQTADQNKSRLLTMARKGQTRPTQNIPLGRVLSNYICKGCGSHDHAFTKRIKKLAPHWFKRCSTR